MSFCSPSWKAVKIADAERLRALGKRDGVDERGAITGELAFRLCGEFLKKEIGDGEFEDGVAEELKPFIMTADGFAMFVEIERCVSASTRRSRLLNEAPSFCT